MCQRCLALQDEADRALARLRAVEEHHGGGIPVGHPDRVYLLAWTEIDGARRESFRRHYYSTLEPTCIACDQPARILDQRRGAMVCKEHAPQ